MVNANASVNPHIWSVPKYPVVHPHPPQSLIYQNIRMGDVARIGAFTALGYWWGFFVSSKAGRRVNARGLAGLGFCGGLLITDLLVAQRLMGLDPNEKEVAKYGARTPEELAHFNKDDVLNGQLIGRVPKFHPDDA